MSARDIDLSDCDRGSTSCGLVVILGLTGKMSEANGILSAEMVYQAGVLTAVRAAAKPANANCAQSVDPTLGVRRFALRNLLSSGRCGIHHCEPHRLRFHVAILITGGQDDHTVDFAPLFLRQGDLLLLRSGQVHSFGKKSTVEGEILTFTDEFVSILPHGAGLLPAIQSIIDSGPRLSLAHESAAAVRRWYDDFSSDLSVRGGANADIRISLAFALLIFRLAGLQEFLPSTAESTQMPRIVRDFESLLASHFLSQRESSWYARQLHMSSRTLDRQLLKARKQTAKELVRARVLLEAKRLLTDSDLQVKDVAYALRFEEVANFSRFFRQNAGITPKEFKLSRPGWTQ